MCVDRVKYVNEEILHRGERVAYIYQYQYKNQKSIKVTLYYKKYRQYQYKGVEQDRLEKRCIHLRAFEMPPLEEQIKQPQQK